MTWLASPFLAMRFVVPMLLGWLNGGMNCEPVWVHDLDEGVAVFASPDNIGDYADGGDWYTVPVAACDGGTWVRCTAEGCK